MKPLSETQDIVQRFNEEEVIWQHFRQKRLARQFRLAESSVPEDILDRLDWLEAERETWVTRAVTQTESLSGESD